MANGGSVYASKFTSRSKLSEIFDATYMGETEENFTYIAPNSEGRVLLPEVTEEHPLSISDTQIKAEISSKEGVMATITLPYTNPDDSSKFSSIHLSARSSNGLSGIYKEFGKGRIIWSSASIEAHAIQSLKHGSIFERIIKSLVQKPLSFEATAPGCVEIVQFHKPDEKRYLINLVNFQSEIGMPNIPVNGITLKVKVEEKALKVMLLPDETSIPLRQDGEYVIIKVPTLQTFHVLALDYKYFLFVLN